MGASTDQIDRQIKQTRARMDENLGALEVRAAPNSIRYARIAAFIAGAAVAGATAFFLYRRLRKPSLQGRLRDLWADGLLEFVDEVASRMKEVRKSMPSVTQTVNDTTESDPGTLESIVRDATPVLIEAASATMLERAKSRWADRRRPIIRPRST